MIIIPTRTEWTFNILSERDINLRRVRSTKIIEKSKVIIEDKTIDAILDQFFNIKRPIDVIEKKLNKSDKIQKILIKISEEKRKPDKVNFINLKMPYTERHRRMIAVSVTPTERFPALSDLS